MMGMLTKIKFVQGTSKVKQYHQNFLVTYEFDIWQRRPCLASDLVNAPWQGLGTWLCYVMKLFQVLLRLFKLEQVKMNSKLQS